MKKITVLMLMGLCLFFSAHICRAEKAYVINTSKITLRGGPSTQDKIIAMLRQGTPVEILDTESGWSHVRVVESGSRNYEGYMVNSFLTSDVPWKVQAEGLKAENIRLKQRAENIEKEWTASSGEKELMSEKLARAEKELNTVKTKYDALRKASGSLLTLQEAHAKTVKALKDASGTLKTLEKENLVLKSSRRNRWFLSGAAVLLVGLIFGLVMGRQQRKKRSSYY
jgi:SH3 domain protein